MSIVKVNSNNFAIELDKIIQGVNLNVQKTVNEAVTKSGRKGAKVLRTVSPVSSSPEGGKYRKSWSCKIHEYYFSKEAIIFNRQPGLPHLLENGHNVVNQYGPTGHSASPIPHIGKGFEAAEQEIEKLLSEGLNKL